MDEKKLSIPDVARMSDLPDSTIRSIITRKNKTVALEVAFKLSNGLDVSLGKLNGETVRMENKTLTPLQQKVISDIKQMNQTDLIAVTAFIGSLDQYKKSFGADEK